jgi:O-antigen/teichoic acid export membrane protein
MTARLISATWRNLLRRSSIHEMAVNSAWLSASQLVYLVLAGSLNILMARWLGVELLGVYTATMALVGMVFVVAQLGVQVPAKREVARNRDAFPKYYGNVLAIRLAISLPMAMLVALPLANRLDIGTDLVVCLMVLFVAANSLVGLLGDSMQALNYFADYTRLFVITQFAYTILVATVLFATGDLEAMLGFMVLVQVAIFGIFYLFLRRHDHRLALAFDRPLWQSLVSQSIPIVLASSTEYVTLRSDTVLVSVFLGDYSTGLYGVAYNVYVVAGIMAWIVSVGTFPTLSRYSVSQSPRRYLSLTLKLNAGLGAYGMILAGAVLLLSPIFLPLLYGQEYSGALDPLRILACALPFVAVNRLMFQVLNASDRQRWTFRAAASGAIFNVAANLYSIPRFGLPAAAVTTVMTEALVWAVALLGFWHSVRADSTRGVG